MESKTLKRMVLLLVLVVMLLGSVAPAMAQSSPTDDAYPTPDPTPSLPMSGLDIALIAAGGTLMLAAGIGMRRAVRNR
ncbi:MAG: hypothetical protein QOG15_3123 [Solirubrobacteraceae bacterium]|jgi:hypothetical protein|nr:hypothetical protein [Solirubrobacteraceae bacterium]